jgi:two-component system, OmpR family, sensor kinase
VSIRLRLTLWQTALLSLVLTAFAVVVHVAVDRQETSQLAYTLRVRAEDVQHAIYDARHAGAAGEAGSIEGPSPALDRAITAALGDGALSAVVLGPDGRELARSENLDGAFPVPAKVVQSALGGDRVLKTKEIGGEEMRLYAEKVSLGRDGGSGALVVAASMRPVAATMARWRWGLVGAVLGTTALASAIGWFLASKAMRPVDRMTQAARAIGRAADFSRRLPEPPQRDELGRLAVTFNEMLSQLGEAFATQRRFLADASHELRTPLTVVRTNAEALQRGVAADPVERAETLRAIVRETDRMGRLVADLLALARADAGQPLTRRRLALDTLVLDVYEQEQALANGVHLDLGEWEQVEVEGDPDRLKQVVLNLVDNALRHTPDGGTVTLDLLRRGEEAVLRVRDTGPGIPQEQLGRIFERFYRVDQPRSRQTGGTGLGLAIAQEVARAHEGRIEVESRLGAGSTFSLVLPVARPSAPDPAAPVPATGTRPLTTS